METRRSYHRLRLNGRQERRLEAEWLGKMVTVTIMCADAYDAMTVYDRLVAGGDVGARGLQWKLAENDDA